MLYIYLINMEVQYYIKIINILTEELESRPKYESNAALEAALDENRRIKEELASKNREMEDLRIINRQLDSKITQLINDKVPKDAEKLHMLLTKAEKKIEELTSRVELADSQLVDYRYLVKLTKYHL
jgi:predicted  nucleic acid-binding Zn-ribbon protein